MFFFVGEPDGTHTAISWKALEQLVTTMKTFQLTVSIQPLSDNTLVLLQCKIFLDYALNG